MSGTAWEYEIAIELSDNRWNIDGRDKSGARSAVAARNEPGEQGWELVTTLKRDGSSNIQFIYKRPKL